MFWKQNEYEWFIQYYKRIYLLRKHGRPGKIKQKDQQKKNKTSNLNRKI